MNKPNINRCMGCGSMTNVDEWTCKHNCIDCGQCEKCEDTNDQNDNS